MGKVIQNVDIASFSIISGQHGYAQDRDHIYGPNGMIPEADPETFKMLTNKYSIDAGHVFFEGRNMPEADSGSFEVINNGLYAIDDHRVFYAGRVLKDVSPEWFTVKGSRAFAADGRTFFEGKIERGGLPTDPEAPIDSEKPEPEKPDTTTPDEETDASAWAAFWEKLTPYTAKLGGQNSAFWIVMALSVLGIFSLLFVFFADRNDEPVSLLKTVAKTLLACAAAILCIWIASLFFKPITAIIIGSLIGLLLFIGLWGVIGWVKALLITILTFIGIILLMTLGFLILRAVFGDTQEVIDFANRPEIQLLNIMKIVGFFGGAWLIASQLGSSLARSIGQSLVATAVSVIILGLLAWMTAIGTVVSVILFSIIYAAVLWLMRFRMVDNLFVESVRIVRIAIILGVVIGLVAWIVL